MRKDRNQVWRYLHIVSGKAKWNIAILLAVQTALGISSIFYALFLRDIINGAVEGAEQKFFSAVVRFALLVCMQLGLRALVRFFGEYSKATLENRFKEKLFFALLDKDYAKVSAVHSGEWMNRLTSDTVVVANGLTEILPEFVGMAVKLVGAVSMIVVLERNFLYLILSGGILLMVFSYAFRKVLKKFHKHVQERDGNLRMYMQESLSGMLVVRSYGVESEITETAAEKMAQHKTARMKKNHFSNLCNVGFGMVMNGAYVLGAFFCGYGILKGTMSYGTFMAVLQLIGQIQAPFANISGFLPKFYSMMASCERLLEAECFPDSGTKQAKTLAEAAAFYQEQLKAIVLSEVAFSYGEKAAELQVLSDVNLSIQKGDFVAVMGTSGCGKSTLLKLLLSVYEPKQGRLEVETTSGQREDIRAWRRLFTYVPQGNCLMSGTIREAVVFYRQEHTSDMTVEKALRLACADFVWELPEGLETVLGEKGAGLSEGQLQRIAIARALYASAPVLILDEATSALDEATEKKLIEQLKKLTDKTILLATHRRAALAICNKKIVFENGSIRQEIISDCIAATTP